MKKLIVLLLGVSLLGCKTTEKQENNPYTAKGGKIYGGTLYLNENDPTESLFPLHISDAVSARISSQVYEGLFKLNPLTLSVEKCLVSDYSIDSTHTLYTFTLKDSVFFHDSECFDKKIGRQLVADDIIFCFQQLCTYSERNHAFSVFHELVQGADEFYKQSKLGKTATSSISGIKKLDKLTFSIQLKHPSTLFTSILSEHQTYIYPKEYLLYSLDENMEKEVGTGPFTLSKVIRSSEPSLVFKRNPKYHMKDKLGNSLPFIDVVHYNFIEDKHSELDTFVNMSTDLINKLPTDLLFALHKHKDSVAFSHDIEEISEMSLDLIGFNCKSSIYSNHNLRKALAFVFDKKKIVERALDGNASEYGKYGITPPTFLMHDNYPVNDIRCPAFNEDSAKYYLERSRVFRNEDVKNLTLYYNLEGHKNDKVVNTISRELKRILGIDLLIKPLHQIEFNHAVESGTAEFFLTSWIYGYPHPQQHLAAFYSSGIEFKSKNIAYPNVFRYSNPKFDNYYNTAFSTENDSIATANYVLAEKILMKDLPVIPLWYDEGYLAKQSYVEDFSFNAIEYWDLRYTYIKPHKVISPEE